MSELRLVVRESDRDWSGTVHGSLADCAVAALSADPVTLAELETACGRFAKPNAGRRFLANLSRGSCDDPYDAGIVVIDLVARLVLVDSTYSAPGLTGAVCYHDEAGATDTWLRYHLAEDWRITSDHCQWRGVADNRRRERVARPVVDVRKILYGRPLLEFVARETLAAYGRPESPAPEEYDAIKEIHAAWLLAPRDELGGICPRDVMLDGHKHIEWDLQDQSQRWSLLDECPPGLEVSSFAFRHGGFGTHELVKYYGLVRELLGSCWARLAELDETRPAMIGPEAFTPGDFLTDEVPRLENVRDHWLETPDPELHGRTPRSVIDRERARLPEGMCGHDAIIDPDCPCCQMMADMPGPVFWHLDGCNMDDDFAFDIDHQTREEWEEERRQWEEDSKRFDARWAERERLGVTGGDSDEPGEKSVWSSSFSVGDAADVPLGIRLFGIGGHLAELIADLRGEAEGRPVDDSQPGPEVQRFIDTLNRDFGNLREVLQNSEPSLAAALIDPVIEHFAESLSAVASARADLAAKCESLSASLARFLDADSAEPTWEPDDSDAQS
jgi:hypothetical protein